jgi:hypothetical protein
MDTFDLQDVSGAGDARTKADGTSTEYILKEKEGDGGICKIFLP